MGIVRHGFWVILTALSAAGGGAAVASEKDFMASIVVEPRNSATLPTLLEELSGERLVYVAETHTAFADHLLQLEVLRSMAAKTKGLALGVEWFQKRFQPALDDYFAGEIDEAEMLRQTEYFDRWRFDYRLYRPIVQFAKRNNIPIIALNASAELTQAISRLGINGLPADLRQQLPDSYDVNDKDYEKTLKEVFTLHGRAHDEAAVQRFIESQLTWDETMAQSASDYLKADPGNRILVLAGKGHIGGRSGIPNRVTRRTGLRGITISSFSPAANRFDAADYLVLTRDRPLPPAGLLRVTLDAQKDGVFVEGFAKDSPAEAAGVEAGDRLLTIDGVAIRHFADVKIAMIDSPPGSNVEVTVQRSGVFGGKRTLSYRIELADGS